MNLDIEKATYESIAAAIHSEESPVGIDAKKTHIIIIEKLMALEQRLERLEKQLQAKNGG